MSQQPISSPTRGGIGSNNAANAKAQAPRKVGKYLLGRTLGQGTFGKVKFAIDTETERHVAIKVMDKAKIKAHNMGDQIKKEISIMKLINHKNVIQLIEVLASPTTIYIVLELVDGGELFDKIVEEGRLDESTARLYFHQLISGIQHCHSHGVCHRDLKPENLLLDSKGNLKISDFGLSALSSDLQDDLLHTTCGTPNYVAPEVLMDKGYVGTAADIWSAGVILYVLLAGFLPFDETSMVELFRKIVKADFAFPAWFSPEAAHLLTIMLNADAEKRADINDIQNHPWFLGQKLPQSGVEQFAPHAGRNASQSMTQHNADTALEITWVDDKGNRGVSKNPSSTQGPVVGTPSSQSGNLFPNSSSFSSGESNESSAYDPLALDEDEESQEPRGPIELNAFDLINMVGGAAMNRMFLKKSDKKNKIFTSFTSTLPLHGILARLEEVLTAMDTQFRIYPKHCIIKTSRSTTRGKLLMSCQIYRMTPTLHMLEWTKMKGDVFAYHDTFREIRQGMTSQVTTSNSVAAKPAPSMQDQYDDDDDDDDEEDQDRVQTTNQTTSTVVSVTNPSLQIQSSSAGSSSASVTTTVSLTPIPSGTHLQVPGPNMTSSRSDSVSVSSPKFHDQDSSPPSEAR